MADDNITFNGKVKAGAVGKGAKANVGAIGKKSRGTVNNKDIKSDKDKAPKADQPKGRHAK